MLDMTHKELVDLENDLRIQHIKLLESMNGYLEQNGWDKKYENMSKQSNRLRDRLAEIEEAIKNGNYNTAPGRPSIGIGKPVKITLPEKDWQKIEEIISSGHAASIADYFRQLHQSQFKVSL